MDNDLKTTIKEFLIRANPLVKDYLSSDDLEEHLLEITEEYNLNEEEFLNVSNITTSILLGITNPDDLLSEIKNKTSLTEKISENLSEEIQNTILTVLSEKIEKNQNNTSQEKVASSGVGDSFEQIILNQAIAMQPAVESAETGRDTSYETRNNTQAKVPENLPIEEERQENVPQNIHNYESGKDPYREPI